ncbi:phospholipase [Streptomyces verrucosisporus]|uniref:alpha/beta hydrolase n=1 Tax=Streptomyces verrucosisporus TaxID=1695161 RepID=UPI0019CF6452|nr:alpha/beta hydrolase-fold protein [Streptomyces verrucosisporus]MBN3932282.1 phospholipase [Streptomyces verrucosisporus]
MAGTDAGGGAGGAPGPERARHRPEAGDGVPQGRLSARPSVSPPPVFALEAGEGAAGTHRLEGRALLRVPPPSGAGAAERPYWLVVVLHEEGGTAKRALTWLLPQAGSGRLLLLAPQAAGSTWDVADGPDVARLDAALHGVFRRFPVDPAGVAVAGFSDGASCALSLGSANGDLFGAVLAFSPGPMAPTVHHGRPRIFVSHGREDPVLPAGACSRRLVPQLVRSGYAVTYREFGGGHEVPPELATEALRWWVDGPRPAARR